MESWIWNTLALNKNVLKENVPPRYLPRYWRHMDLQYPVIQFCDQVWHSVWHLGSATQQNTKLDNIWLLPLHTSTISQKRECGEDYYLLRFSPCNHTLVSRDLVFSSFKYTSKISQNSSDHKIWSELFHLLYWFLGPLMLLFLFFFFSSNSSNKRKKKNSHTQ